MSVASRHSMVLTPSFVLLIPFLLSVAMVSGGSPDTKAEETDEVYTVLAEMEQLHSRVMKKRTVHTVNKLFPKERNHIVLLHNLLRMYVHPPASSMRPLRWGRRLGVIAQTHANKCIFDHNPNRGGNIGENLYFHPKDGNVLKAVMSWYLEHKDYNYETNSCNHGKVCGHYTQVVWAKTKRVGCGITYCERTSNIPWEPSSGYIIVCNYRRRGNVVGHKPYETDTERERQH